MSDAATEPSHWGGRLLRVRPGEAAKVLQFSALGLLLQMGLGIGMSAGDAAFLSHLGAGQLPLIFILTPAVMLVYTPVFSLLLSRFGVGRLTLITLGVLVLGGIGVAALLNLPLPEAGRNAVYFAVRLYGALWYIGLYTLFWNFTDSYFDIQDAKRLFPLFAAACAAGNALGAGLVSVLAGQVATDGLFGLWAVLAAATAPLVLHLRRRWPQLPESETNDEEEDAGQGGASPAVRLAAMLRVFLASRFSLTLAAVVFTTLILTNLLEYQYSTILQKGLEEAELTRLLGRLYAAAGVANIFICLFVFNRLVTSAGVRNVALILPTVYILVFSYLFAASGVGAALAAFFAYHTVLTAIEYNNQNLMFNATPTRAKRQVRTFVEGLCEPFASVFSGGLLLLTAQRMDVRELAGVGALIAQGLFGLALLQRAAYPRAMAAKMRDGFLDFGGLHRAATARPPGGRAIRALLARAQDATPRERRRLEAELVAAGPAALPDLVATLRSRAAPYASRALAARALSSVAPAQLQSLAGRLVDAELGRAGELQALGAAVAAAAAGGSAGLTVLARAYEDQSRRGLDFALEVLGLIGVLPDVDQLEACLRAASPKVRANALESLESSLSRRTFGKIRPLVLREGGRGDAAPLDLEAALAETLSHGGGVAQAAAVQAVHERDGAAAIPRLRKVLRSGPGEVTRRTLTVRLGLQPETATPVDIIADLLTQPGFADAEMDCLAWLALRAQAEGDGSAAAGQRIPTAAVDAAVARFPDLALGLFSAREGGYAA